jgi:hypothetical protein
LRVDGEAQLARRAFVEHAHEAVAEDARGDAAHAIGFGQAFVGAQHADRLRTLPRKHHRELHLPRSSRASRPR